MTLTGKSAKILPMNRVVPLLKNGNLTLVISETLCIDPTQGLELMLPINLEKKLKIIFDFGDKEKQDNKVEMSVEGDVLKIKFSNFLNTLEVSVNPLNFTVGSSSFLIRMYGFSNNPNILSLTISVFNEEETNG